MHPLLLKDTGTRVVDIVRPEDLGLDKAFENIRCPLCAWQPEPSSRWSCQCRDTPEPAFASCGTIWNTFATRGRCPGCAHQWRWTSCLACGEFSPHDDWYEQDISRP